MRNGCRSLGCFLLLWTSAWLAACDEDASTAGQGADGAGDAGGRSSRCRERPQVFASEGVFNCVYACREGYADCDDSRDNGCETDLGSPDACARCGLAFSCLMPELCGESIETCSGGSVQGTAIRGASGFALDLGGFVADGDGQHILAIDGLSFADSGGSERAIDLSGGVAFRYRDIESGDHLWTSLPGPDRGTAPRVERFGDQLVFFGREAGAFGREAGAVVITSTDLDGTQRWSSRLPTSGSATVRDVILDPEGNLYAWVKVSSGELTVGARTYEQGSSIDDLDLLLSYTPGGDLRWISDAETPFDVWDTEIKEWKALVILGDRVAVLRRGNLAIFARADGSYKGPRSLSNVFAAFAEGDAFVAKDGAGDVYIAAVSRADAVADELPMPSAVPPDTSEIPGRYHLHVTKHEGAMLGVVWRRSLFWDDRYVRGSSPLSSDSGLHIESFTVGADGFSWVVASARFGDVRQQFLVGLAADGRVEVARYMSLSQHVQFVRVAGDAAPYLAGTYTNWEIGGQLFERSGIFVERDFFEALAP